MRPTAGSERNGDTALQASSETGKKQERGRIAGFPFLFNAKERSRSGYHKAAE